MLTPMKNCRNRNMETAAVAVSKPAIYLHILAHTSKTWKRSSPVVSTIRSSGLRKMVMREPVERFLFLRGIKVHYHSLCRFY